jgi:lysozyme
VSGLLETVRSAPQTYFGGCFDISHHNGTIKWTHIPESYRLVFIKATQGTRFVDPRFGMNLEGARDRKLMAVPYHFINQEPVELQVHNFANAAGLQSGSVTMIDWESEDASKLPNVTLVAQMIDSLKLLTGRLPLVYHGMYLVTSPKINSCPWFVPKYGPEPRSRNWLFWQDTMSAGDSWCRQR